MTDVLLSRAQINSTCMKDVKLAAERKRFLCFKCWFLIVHNKSEFLKPDTASSFCFVLCFFLFLSTRSLKFWLRVLGKPFKPQTLGAEIINAIWQDWIRYQVIMCYDHLIIRNSNPEEWVKVDVLKKATFEVWHLLHDGKLLLNRWNTRKSWLLFKAIPTGNFKWSHDCKSNVD